MQFLQENNQAGTKHSWATAAGSQWRLILWQGEVDPMSYPGNMSHSFELQIIVPVQASLEKIDRIETAREQSA